MRDDAHDIAQPRLPRRIELDDLVVGAGQYAMRGGQDEVGCERDT